MPIRYLFLRLRRCRLSAGGTTFFVLTKKDCKKVRKPTAFENPPHFLALTRLCRLSAAGILLTFLRCQESDKEAKNLQFYRLVRVRSKVFVRLPTGISLTQSVRKIVGTRRMRYKRKWCDADVCVQGTQNAIWLWRGGAVLVFSHLWGERKPPPLGEGDRRRRWKELNLRVRCG